MDNDDKVMLYLYKDVGLFWERTLGREENRDMCAMTANKGLRTFFSREDSIVYNITNAKDMNQRPIKDNELSFTDSKSSIVRSLVHHLRNSIMHGLYKITRKGSNILVEFEDIQPGAKVTTTLKGRVELTSALSQKFRPANWQFKLP
jgi:hypothetical protein